MGRLFREAPVNSIWEGSGNVMCLDVLRAVSRNPDDVQLVLDQLADIAAGEPRVLTQLQQVRSAFQHPPAELEREARRLTQKLALCVQAGLMLQHASPLASAAFIGSRFDADWGPVVGVSAGTEDVAALLREAWTAEAA